MSSSDQQVVIFVVGMHRSGTSALTRLLNLLGAEVGDRLLGSSPGINDKGFWEHQELVALDEEILGRMGRTWYDFRPWPDDWWQGETWSDLLPRMRAFLSEAFADAPLAALKDPRLCRLLPLWLRALEGGPWSPRVVLALRDPAEIAASLGRRDPIDPELAAWLWLMQMRDADLASRSLPRATADYGDLLSNWRAVAEALGQGLGVLWPVDPAAVADQVAQELDPALRHYRSDQVDADSGPLAELAAKGHRMLRDGNAPDAVWATAAELAASGAAFETVLYRTQQRLFEQTVRLQDSGEALTAARATVESRDAAIRDLQQELSARGRDHRQALDTVEERDRQIEALATEHRHALAVVSEKDGQIEHLVEQYEHAASVVRERDAQLADLQERIQRVRRIPVLGPLYRWLMRPRS